jgi:two-component system, OmpR family, phosphate regulon sensor histidine kinase PhoR
MSSNNTKDHILVLVADSQIRFLLERVLASTGYSFTFCKNSQELGTYLKTQNPILAIFHERLENDSGINLAASVTARIPGIPVVLLIENDNAETMRKAMSAGVTEYLVLPTHMEEIVKAVQNGLIKAHYRQEWVHHEAKKITSSLRHELNELETLSGIGQSITSIFDLDAILSKVVDAAVTLSNAEEGSLLLLDEETGELYMRAARNFQEDFVRTFRMKVNDSLVSSVLQSGEPFLLDDKTPQKIKTAYFVHSLIYVPLKSQGKILGVLGVDNRLERMQFKSHEVKLLIALADYASIALENSRLFESVMHERNKLETILAKIQDGVIVVDKDRRLVMVNHMARSIFHLSDEDNLVAKPFDEVFPNKEILSLLETSSSGLNNQREISLEDGRAFNAAVTTIPEVGAAITLNDITYLKKLDRIKSDFVTTVSHDLRSPLTAIMGYVELIERAGPINDTQRDFVRRVTVSVQNITRLVDDLLNLGRIEAGFDIRKDRIQFDQLVRFALEGSKKSLGDKQLELDYSAESDLPMILANPVQLRQMVENLIDNAVKYTPPGGKILIHISRESNQIILQISDTGIGIPALDIPFIFDKFYRASNTVSEMAGTGLGLSIVRSILENHMGRIWVDSTEGQGSTFTVVLPVIEP